MTRQWAKKETDHGRSWAINAAAVTGDAENPPPSCRPLSKSTVSMNASECATCSPAVTWNHLCNLFYYPQVGTVCDRGKIADVAGSNARFTVFQCSCRRTNCDITNRLKAITVICMTIENVPDSDSFSKTIVTIDREKSRQMHITFFLLFSFEIAKSKK